MKKDIMRFSFVLGAIAVVTAFGVAGVYQMTRSRIEEKQRVAFENALRTMFPDATRFVPVVAGKGAAWDGARVAPWDGTKGVGKAVGASGVLGYVAVGEKQGYSSKIRVLVACDSQLAVKAVRVLYAAETPGLGERVKEVKSDRTVWQAFAEAVGLRERSETGGAIEPWFPGQFAGKTLDQLTLVKGETKNNIQAITAATVTSRAVTEAVKSAVKDIAAASAGEPVTDGRR
jgi:electron transport complex protein RnfG